MSISTSMARSSTISTVVSIPSSKASSQHNPASAALANTMAVRMISASFLSRAVLTSFEIKRDRYPAECLEVMPRFVNVAEDQNSFRSSSIRASACERSPAFVWGGRDDALPPATNHPSAQEVGGFFAAASLFNAKDMFA